MTITFPDQACAFTCGKHIAYCILLKRKFKNEKLIQRRYKTFC